MTKAFFDEIGELDKTLKLITEKQFKRVMRQIKLDSIKYDGIGIDEVFSYFDFDEKGLIHYDDVILAIFPPKREKLRAVDVEDILDRIRRKMLDMFEDPKEDADELFMDALKRRGKSKQFPFIDKGTFQHAMKSLKMAIDEAEIDAIYDAYGQTKKGSNDDFIDYEEFIEKLAFKDSKTKKGSRK